MKRRAELALVVTAFMQAVGCGSVDSDILSRVTPSFLLRTDRSRDAGPDLASVAEQKKPISGDRVISPPASNTRRQIDVTYRSTRTGVPTVSVAPLPSLSNENDKDVNSRLMEKRETNLTSPNRVRLISPESPLAEFGCIGEMWGLYRAFEFQRVIEFADRCSASAQATGYEVATVYVLAAASAYLDDDQERALSFLRQAVRADHAAIPHEKYFPSTLCALYRQVAVELAH